jgi:hypothetical protein
MRSQAARGSLESTTWNERGPWRDRVGAMPGEV